MYIEFFKITIFLKIHLKMKGKKVLKLIKNTITDFILLISFDPEEIEAIGTLHWNGRFCDLFHLILSKNLIFLKKIYYFFTNILNRISKLNNNINNNNI